MQEFDSSVARKTPRRPPCGATLASSVGFLPRAGAADASGEDLAGFGQAVAEG